MNPLKLAKFDEKDAFFRGIPKQSTKQKIDINEFVDTLEWIRLENPHFIEAIGGDDNICAIGEFVDKKPFKIDGTRVIWHISGRGDILKDVILNSHAKAIELLAPSGVHTGVDGKIEYRPDNSVLLRGKTHLKDVNFPLICQRHHPVIVSVVFETEKDAKKAHLVQTYYCLKNCNRRYLAQNIVLCSYGTVNHGIIQPF
jgi:hypothetical protein